MHLTEFRSLLFFVFRRNSFQKKKGITFFRNRAQERRNAETQTSVFTSISMGRVSYLTFTGINPVS